MGKTTNILDLNNRLSKVEKENVAQNSYTSLKNKPKINSVTLTGNKSLEDIGAAAASDLIKVTTLSDNININTQGGSLYRSALIPISCDSEPTDVVVNVTRSSGAIVGAMVHSISGTTVNVIVWATENIQENIKIVLFYR